MSNAILFVKKRKRVCEYKKRHTLYRVWYGDEIVYVGHTASALFRKLRSHFFHEKGHCYLDVHQTTRIDYATYKTRADMFLYETYYINTYHPRLNRASSVFAEDDLTIALPVRRWTTYKPRLMEKWRSEIKPRKPSSRAPAKPEDVHCSDEVPDSLALMP